MILISLGDAYRRLGGRNWNLAQKCYTDAKNIFEELNDLLMVGVCLRKVAGVYIFQGQYKEALPLCEESLKIFESADEKRGIYKAYQHKAWAYDFHPCA